MMRPPRSTHGRSRRLEGFAPIVGARPRVLVLGSMPSPASLAAGEYYAHPRNLFWRVAAGVTRVPAGASYQRRCAGLRRAGIAVWDIVGRCRRRGSGDAAIETRDMEARDVAAFLRRHSSIGAVLFNGAFAERVFRRAVLAAWRGRPLRLQRMPSTSPAHASVPPREKLRRWGRALRGAIEHESLSAPARARMRRRRRRR